MTPASALSRLEKLASEYARETYPALYEKNAGVIDSAVKDFTEGYKAALSALSEPGEACGPRAWLDYDEEHLSYLPLHGSTEYCDLRELTQARAALASSEARVRSLLFVSEIAARTLKNLKHGLELSLSNCPGGADETANKIHLQRIEETLKALLEVQG